LGEKCRLGVVGVVGVEEHISTSWRMIDVGANDVKTKSPLLDDDFSGGGLFFSCLDIELPQLLHSHVLMLINPPSLPPPLRPFFSCLRFFGENRELIFGVWSSSYLSK